MVPSRRTSKVRPDKPKHRIHAASRRLAEAQIAALITDYEAGASASLLMDRYEIGKGTVLRILSRGGVERRQPPTFTAEMLALATRLYLQGMSCQQIADNLDRDAKTVWRQLRQAGVQLRPGQGGPPKRRP